jgi:hypothetical protein
MTARWRCTPKAHTIIHDLSLSFDIFFSEVSIVFTEQWWSIIPPISTKQRQLKLWWSIIPPISTKRTISSHLNSLNIKSKNTTYTWPLTVFVPLKHILVYMTAHWLCTPKAHTIIHDLSLSFYIFVSEVSMVFTALVLRYKFLFILQLKLWWSIIPPISTKRTISSHLNSLNIKSKNTTTYVDGNTDLDLE